MKHRGAALTGRWLFVLFLFPCWARARPQAPLPETAFDGGAMSAETLGRGDTFAATPPTAAAGSENPASLGVGIPGALYSTALVGTRSSLPHGVVNNADPLNGRTLQYLSLVSDKGVLYFEPLARFHADETSPEPGIDARSVDFVANAIGFAGAAPFAGTGQAGLSVAYLWSSLQTFETPSNGGARAVSDTANGFRLNLGVRYPTGPVSWGLDVQNAPAFLWGGEFRRELLPIRVRVGNSYTLAQNIILSADAEQRFYEEGGQRTHLWALGLDIPVSDAVSLRTGTFGSSLSDEDKRHVTGGVSIKASTGLVVTYAIDAYRLAAQSVKRSYVSLSMPFQTESSGNQ